MTRKGKITLGVYLIAILGTLFLIWSLLSQYLAWGLLYWDDGKTDMDIVNRNLDIFGFSLLAAIALEAFLILRLSRFVRRERRMGTGPKSQA